MSFPVCISPYPDYNTWTYSGAAAAPHISTSVVQTSFARATTARLMQSSTTLQALRTVTAIVRSSASVTSPRPVSTGTSTTRGSWQLRNFTNCYVGQGGVSVSAASDPLPGVFSVSTCQAQCVSTASCGAIVIRSNLVPSPCWLRQTVSFPACISPFPDYNTWVYSRPAARMQTNGDALRTSASSFGRRRSSGLARVAGMLAPMMLMWSLCRYQY